MASRETDKPLLLSAMLASKDEPVSACDDHDAIFFTDYDIYLGIEVEDVAEDVERSYYSVSLYVADIKVSESRKSKPRLSVVKWDWKANNQM